MINNYYLVNYEELVENPSLHIKNICKHLNVAFESLMLGHIPNAEELGDVANHNHHLNVTKPISTKNIGKGLINLNQIDKDNIKHELKRKEHNVILKNHFKNYLI